MKLQTILGTAIIATLLLPAMSANATDFWRVGKVTRILTDSATYNGCMLWLDQNIANGCPNNGWVSLDCAGNFSAAGVGKTMYATAMLGMSLNKKVYIKIDNTKKVNGYCTAKQIHLRN
jgi:hypothetical protein